MTATSTFSVALANETATAELMADLALLIGAGDGRWLAGAQTVALLGYLPALGIVLSSATTCWPAATSM